MRHMNLGCHREDGILRESNGHGKRMFFFIKSQKQFIPFYFRCNWENKIFGQAGGSFRRAEGVGEKKSPVSFKCNLAAKQTAVCVAVCLPYSMETIFSSA